MSLQNQIFKESFAKLQGINNSKSIPSETNNQMLHPTGWESYFQINKSVSIDTANSIAFNVYINGLEGQTGPIYFFHHGAGLSALSFGLVAKQVFLRDPTSTVLCFDSRGHGKTESVDNHNLSLDQLVKDTKLLFCNVFGETDRQVVLVGHSMGGAVMVELALVSGWCASLMGIVVVDVVEGTAIEAFKFARVGLSLRPSSFNSIKDAINYHFVNGEMINYESARLSVPSLLKEVSGEDGLKKYIWVTDVLDTQKYWKGWYSGLSKKFLSVKAAKLLVLAETNRLDKELMIGQMQGKFQLKLLSGSGHLIPENNPTQFADSLIEFAFRNKKIDLETLKALRSSSLK